jgi:hypothetical protein
MPANCSRRPGRSEPPTAGSNHRDVPLSGGAPGRSHHTLGQEGWEEVDGYTLDWAVSHAAEITAV